MALRITHDTMTLGIDNRVVSTARFTREEAIAALTIAWLGKSGYSDAHPLGAQRTQVICIPPSPHRRLCPP